MIIIARGQLVKQEVMDKILSTFEGSFVDGKVVRIPMYENGELVQIKVQLTAAKDIIDPDGEEPDLDFSQATPASNTEVEIVKEPTKEELEKTKNFMETLGLF